MMKILIINTTGLNFEGISISIVSYLEAMDRSDLKIDFALVSQDFHPDMLEMVKEMGCDIRMLPPRKKSTLRYFFALTRLMRKNRYHIVHAHGNSATLAIEMWAAIWAGCKVRIAHSHNTCTSYPKLDKLLRPFFYISYTQGFACSTEAGRWLFGHWEFRVIPNGKDISKFTYNSQKRMEYRTRLNLTDKVVIGHAGNFNYQKNHEFLIKIFKELAGEDEPYVLYLMGDGALRPHIQKMVKEYGLEDKVIFTGSIANMADMLQAMDIMVLPSRFEGLPTVVLEWQLACLPCVISDAITKECKLTDLVSYLSIDEGPAAWADKIRSLKIIDREEIAGSMLAKIRQAGFDIGENARWLKEIYHQLLPVELSQDILRKEMVDIMDDLSKLHSLLLMLAREVKRICELYQIKYFLMEGSLLGAVRHKGFIPWDDDMDIGMLRPDFEKFIKACQGELNQEKFYLQTGQNDRQYTFDFIKLRLNGTKVLEEFSASVDTHQGIYIDIFPFDNVPANLIKKYCQRKQFWFYRNLLWVKCGYGNKKRKKELKYKLARFISCFFTNQYLKNKKKRIITSYNDKISGYVVSGDGTYGLEKETIPRAWIESLATYQFEDDFFMGIKDYDAYLGHIYGDYMQLPPVEKRNHHKRIYIDYGDYAEIQVKQDE